MDFNKMRAMLLDVVFIFALQFGDAKTSILTGSPWWSLATSDLPADILQRPLPLTEEQLKFVKNNPGALKTLIRSANMAIQECQFQFKNNTWKCPTMDDGQGGITFGNVLEKGYKETAFIHAISSAAVTHSVARGCAEGTLYTCTCSKDHEGEKLEKYHEWGGCSDNLKFGRKFSRKFLDSSEKQRDFRSLVNLHNNAVGRLHVLVRDVCKCHGFTGDCCLVTCWKIVKPFRHTGYALKRRFDKASKVIPGLYVRSTAKVIYGREKLRKKEKPEKVTESSVSIRDEKDTNEWLKNPDHIYVGRNNKHSTGTRQSIWGNNLLWGRRKGRKPFKFSPARNNKPPEKQDLVYYEDFGD